MTATTTTTGSCSSIMSNDSVSTAAPATPATENDEMGSDSDQDEDYDTGDDDNEMTVANLAEGSNAPYDRVLYHSLEWANVEPPAALRDVDESDGILPEILCQIIVSSIESVQSQLAVKAAEQAEREAAAAAAAAKAHAEAEAAAREAALAEAEAIRRQQKSSMELQESPVIHSKGKGRETSAQPFAEADPTQASASIKVARLPFTSRVLRHVHKLSGSSSGGGESSTYGAASEAAATKAAAKAAKAARLARQKAYEEAMLRRFETGSSAPARAEAGPSKATSLQQAYEQAMLISLEGGAAASQTITTKASSTSSTVTGASDVDVTLLPAQRRAAMLLAIVRKEPILPATIECVSCFDDIPVKEAVKTVCHSYCLACFGQLVTTALDNEAQFPPKCCLNEVPVVTVNKYIPHELKRRYKLKLDEYATPLNDRVYCPTPDCGVWVPPAHIAPAARTARCRNGHETCTACRQAAHGRGSANREACPEASAQDRRHQELANELAREEGWRHCIQCAVLIEHRDACQHMTCRCGAEFCYVCGLIWRTCRCDMEDLQRLKDQAATRRTQRTEREARERERVRQQEEAADAELAELRDALAQIAAFEQREREQLRQVQQAQRARLHQLKEDREVALRVEVATKFESLRIMLGALGEQQFSKAGNQRKEQRASLKAEVTEKYTAAVARQGEIHAEALAEAAGALRAVEQHWQRDYCVRLALEVQLESEYEQALTGGLPISEVRGAGAALKDYQRINDARVDAYCAWRDRALAHACEAIEMTRRVKGDEAKAVLRRLRSEGRRQQRSLDYQHTGERTWCRAVAAERMRLLYEMEMLEQELGLAGSTSEVDSNLLLLLELDASGALGSDGEGDAVDDTEMSHLYAMMLADAVGDVDDADLRPFGGAAAWAEADSEFS